jgi:hypothetical protein
MVTAFVVLVTALALTVVLVVILPLGGATAERSSAQGAADAAALAGAGDVADQVVSDLSGSFDDLGSLLDLLFAGAGCAASSVGKASAASFADRNAAELTAYCVDWRHGEVTASVERYDSASSGGGALARATASMGFDPSQCVAPAGFPPAPPSPTPTTTEPSPTGPTPTTTEPPPPPPDDELAQLSCGPMAFRLRWSGESGKITFDPPPEIDDLEPYLTH